jgi:hypothetical protein
LYEAEEARDPRARRAEASAAPDDAAARLEELPDDFDDEEIDEDTAFTAADKAKWGDLDEYGGGGGGSDDDDDGDEDIEWEDGEGDMLEQLEAAQGERRGSRVRRLRPRQLGRAALRAAALRPRSPRVPAQGAPAADVDEFLGGGSEEEDDDDDDEEDDALGAGGDASRRHAVMLQAAGVGAATRKRKLAKARPSRAAAAARRLRRLTRRGAHPARRRRCSPRRIPSLSSTPTRRAGRRATRSPAEA